MKVKLISHTQTPDNKSLMEQVAFVARVSNPANQHNDKTAPKLVKYLMDNKHWSPLEMCHATMEIECTRDIARQILRHRSFSFQEFSQRYAKINEMVLTGVRLQDNKNRQNSIETDDKDLKYWWTDAQAQIEELSSVLYQEALRQGIAKEVARKVLPEGMTMSRLYMSGSLRSWLHYIEVRTHESTQKEHRQVAEAIKTEIRKVFDYE